MRYWIIALLIGCNQDYNLQGKDSNVGEDEDSRPPQGGDDPGQPADPSLTASVTGRVCNTANDGYVVGATASISYDASGDGSTDGVVQDVTDQDGYFLLEGVPLGQHDILVEKGSFSIEIPVVLDTEGELVELAEEECLDPGSVEIAVITGQYDSIGDILRGLALDFDTYNGINNQYLSLLNDPAKMADYDIIFFNCGMSDTWRPNAGTIGQNVADYVRQGGSIYASDWAFTIYEAAFPDAVDFYGNDQRLEEVAVGVSGNLRADVLNSNFQAALGSSTASLYYDLDAWAVPIAGGSSVEVLIQGDAVALDLWTFSYETVRNAPLALRLEKGDGVAIYTSFHNENQITVDMERLLEEIIYSL